MAVCKRCGTTFDYKKREGVCPKCCFYNRPENAWQEDDSWIKNYNYEDNSYDISAHDSDGSESEDSLRNVFRRNNNSEDRSMFRISGHNGEKDLEGSHVHLDDGKVVKAPSNPKRLKQKKSAMQPKSLVILVVVVIWILFILFNELFWF